MQIMSITVQVPPQENQPFKFQSDWIQTKITPKA